MQNSLLSGKRTSSHLCTTGALCADWLSQMTWMAWPGSVCRSISSRKFRKSTARCWADRWPMTLPVAVFSGKTGRCAVPDVVMAAPLGHPGDHRQHRRGPPRISLDLRLLVGREDRRADRRRQVQPDDVADL